MSNDGNILPEANLIITKAMPAQRLPANVIDGRPAFTEWVRQSGTIALPDS